MINIKCAMSKVVYICVNIKNMLIFGCLLLG